MTEAAFQRIVERTWTRMAARDPRVTRAFVESYLRLIRHLGGGGKQGRGS